MLLYAVTDRTWLNGKTVAQQVSDALVGGSTFIQLREKQLDQESFLEEARQIKALCKQYEVPFVINDNVEIAIACDADGVHIGQHDMEVRMVRKMLGNDKIIGVSVQTVEQAVQAEQGSADYLGVGAVFSTSTKLDADSVSFETLKAICEAVTIPVIAIGGITEENIGELAGTGIDGVAVVSAVFSQPDIISAVKKLKTLSQKMVNDEAIKGAIFDLDGVLLDSMSVWDTLGEQYLIAMGKKPQKDIQDILRPMSLIQAATYFQTEYGITESVSDIIGKIDGLLERFYREDVKLKPGVADYISGLKRKNIKMCITTATERFLAEAALKRNNIEGYFDEILTCNEVEHGKDEPEIYFRALAILGTSKEDTLVYEDALHAVQTAEKAGFRVVAVYDKSAEMQRAEIEKIADMYMESFEQ